MIDMAETTTPFDGVLAALAAAGEPTRLRLLALLSDAELTVSELFTILGQSQPRISRHLKLLVEAGLVERHREGAWVFLLLAHSGATARLAREILGSIAGDDPVFQADRARLDDVRRMRAGQAARYFETHAATWDRVRAMHVAEETVEIAVRDAIGSAPVGSLLDIGTGTGRMLEVLAPQAGRALGVDQSAPMLATRTSPARTCPGCLGSGPSSLQLLSPCERVGWDRDRIPPPRASRDKAETCRAPNQGCERQPCPNRCLLP